MGLAAHRGSRRFGHVSRRSSTSCWTTSRRAATLSSTWSRACLPPAVHRDPRTARRPGTRPGATSGADSPRCPHRQRPSHRPIVARQA